MSLNPPTQYATDANLRARQRLWDHQQPAFDLVSWVVEVAGVSPGSTARVLDVGCGNGMYLARLRAWSIAATGCDLSRGMLAAARATEESAVQVATPGWEMRNPSTHAFSLENGEGQLRLAFSEVACVCATEVVPVVLTDASVAADYVASIEDHYQLETTRPWAEVVDEVRRSVQRQIDASGSFIVQGHSGAFVCE